jgi:hypothetical protein
VLELADDRRVIIVGFDLSHIVKYIT